MEEKKRISPLEDIKVAFSNIKLKTVLIILPFFGLLLYFLSGIYIVNPGEEAVIRRFGKWYLNNGEVDNNGNPTVAIDPKYYPEVRGDCVPTPDEFDKEYLMLSKTERLKKLETLPYPTRDKVGGLKPLPTLKKLT